MAKFSEEVKALALRSVGALKSVKQLANAKQIHEPAGTVKNVGKKSEYTRTSDYTLYVLSEVGGFVPEPIGSIQLDGKTYNVGLKLSLTLTEAKEASKAKASDVI